MQHTRFVFKFPSCREERGGGLLRQISLSVWQARPGSSTTLLIRRNWEDENGKSNHETSAKAFVRSTVFKR